MNSAMQKPPLEPLPVKPLLSLWDIVSIIVGIIIGVGIFETPARVIANVPGPGAALMVWLVGGLFALTGAMCFSELASAYPRSGGEYVYLGRAFGPLSGFLFAWSQLTVIRTGSIAAFAYIFANHGGMLWGLGPQAPPFLAALAILALTGINILGVTFGTRTQNVLTVAKILGLVGIVIAGLGWGHGDLSAGNPAAANPRWFAMAMIFVLWTYSGWHEAAYVVMEVRNRRRNIPLALCLGTAAVTAIYLLVNTAYLLGLGFEAAQQESAQKTPKLADHVVALALGDLGARAIHVLIMISALGAINGMIFTSARIYAEMGADHRLFAFLSKWNERLGTPLRSLMLQGVLSAVMAIGVGWWFGGQDGFDVMVEATAAVFWLFFLLTAASLVVLRWKDRDLERPFRVPGYPVVPLVFAAGCAYMVHGSVDYKPILSLIGLGLILAGVPVYFWSRLSDAGVQAPQVRRVVDDEEAKPPPLPEPNRFAK
jgi:amino acid transporter